LEDETMKGKAHYLSWMSQNKFISLCGDLLQKYIFEKNVKKYSIIADTTSDAYHEEQMC
jgi:hypothetical protein